MNSTLSGRGGAQVSTLFSGMVRSGDSVAVAGMNLTIRAIGATPLDNLFLNTGHGTLGWTMACGSGQVIADIIGGRPPAIETADLGLARYRR